jgi:hypothetical protein
VWPSRGRSPGRRASDHGCGGIPEVHPPPGAGSHGHACKRREAREGRGETAGGVDANKTKDELLEEARDAGIEGRSTMDKGELVDALRRFNDRRTAKAR